MKPASSQPFDFDAALRRIPRWILLLTFAGLPLAYVWGQIEAAGGFLGGALLGYVNYWIIERAVNRISRAATATLDPAEKPGAGSGFIVFIQFGALALLAFVILRVSGINLSSAFIGFLVCPGAVVVEILYELLTYGHT